ncbi:MAG: hypothetical protein WCT27_00100 [Patescibacteria group bacterium]|jgi:hypothetical protein
MNDRLESEVPSVEPEQPKEIIKTPEDLKADREFMETRRHDFETLYKYMKRYVDEGWTLMKIEAHSPQLNETIRSMREVLQAAGVADTDGLLEGLLTEVRKCHELDKDKFEFIETIFDHTKMDGGPIQKFYEAFSVGLKALQETETKKMAA